MADIAWTAYALAMFSPEQRAAAAAGEEYIPEEPRRPITQPTSPTVGIVGGWLIDGLNPNIPEQQAELFRRGWSFRSGQWVRLGTAVTPLGDPPTGRTGLSSVIPLSTSQSGSVLGYTVPAAPPVLLPSYVGGRIGSVIIGAGLRPSSIGQSIDERFQLGTGWRVIID